MGCRGVEHLRVDRHSDGGLNRRPVGTGRFEFNGGLNKVSLELTAIVYRAADNRVTSDNIRKFVATADCMKQRIQSGQWAFS